MKTLGIIGGMGPLAAADLLEKIVQNTQAKKDQDNIHVILDSNTHIPDRTAAIRHGGSDPRPQLQASACRLEAAGAGVLAISCNTAHYFYKDVSAAVSVPVLHMPRLTAGWLCRTGLTRAALLATDGTVQSGIYQAAFAGSGVDLLMPDGEGQQAVMSLIYEGVKAGKAHFNTAAIRAALARLQAAGAGAFILGCTELPLAFSMYGLPGRTIDPTTVLARAAVAACGGLLTAG